MTSSVVHTGLDEVQSLNLANSVPVAVVLNTPTLSANLASPLPSNTTYYYEVTAVFPTGESDPGNQQSVTTTASQQQINLTWAAIPSAVSYNIYRTNVAGQYSSVSLLANMSAAAVSVTSVNALTGAITAVAAAPTRRAAATPPAAPSTCRSPAAAAAAPWCRPPPMARGR